MRILIVRHADPDYDIDSLTDTGWKEAELAADYLSKINVKAILCITAWQSTGYSRMYIKKDGQAGRDI